MAYPEWTYKGHITFNDTAKAEAVHALVYIYYQSGMRSDFGDLRFADLSGNALPYYFDYYTAGSIARVWVKVPAGQTTINFYYGNPSATSESSGTNTFDFFDEFYGITLYIVFPDSNVSFRIGAVGRHDERFIIEISKRSRTVKSLRKR